MREGVEIALWRRGNPIPLDPARLSLRMQVWRIVFMIGMKAMLEGKLGREAAVSSESSRSEKASALVTSRPVRGKSGRAQGG